MTPADTPDIPPPLYVTSGNHLTGYRVTLGYATLAEAQAAHEAIALRAAQFPQARLVNWCPDTAGRWKGRVMVPREPTEAMCAALDDEPCGDPGQSVGAPQGEAGAAVASPPQAPQDVAVNLGDAWEVLDRAMSKFEDRLLEVMGDFVDLGHDDYDDSLEIHGVDDDVRLSEDAQNLIYNAGFSKCYVNHENGSGTVYSWHGPTFAPVEGWRGERTGEGRPSRTKYLTRIERASLAAALTPREQDKTDD